MWQDTLVSTGLLPPILLNQVFVMVTNPNSTSFTQSPSILTFLTHRHLGHCLSSLSLLLNLPVPTHITLETILSTSFRSWNLPGDYATPPCFLSSRAQHSTAQHQPLTDFSLCLHLKNNSTRYQRQGTGCLSPFDPIQPPPLGDSHLLPADNSCILFISALLETYCRVAYLYLLFSKCATNKLYILYPAIFFLFTFWDKSRMFKYLWSSCLH